MYLMQYIWELAVFITLSKKLQRITGGREEEPVRGPSSKNMTFYFNIGHDIDLIFLSKKQNALSYIGTKLENSLIANIWIICALLTK